MDGPALGRQPGGRRWSGRPRLGHPSRLRFAPVALSGGGYQLTRHVAGLLFLSLLSGRNPHYLVGEQVIAAPRVKALGIETVGTAYLLIESGATTSVGFISGHAAHPQNQARPGRGPRPGRRDDGLRMPLLEAGSGAELPVPVETVRAVRKHVGLPLIVGGGLRTPESWPSGRKPAQTSSSRARWWRSAATRPAFRPRPGRPLEDLRMIDIHCHILPAWTTVPRTGTRPWPSSGPRPRMASRAWSRPPTLWTAWTPPPRGSIRTSSTNWSRGSATRASHAALAGRGDPLPDGL